MYKSNSQASGLTLNPQYLDQNLKKVVYQKKRIATANCSKQAINAKHL